MKRILLHLRTKTPNEPNELRVNPEMIESYVKEGGKPGSIIFFQGKAGTSVTETPEAIDTLIDEVENEKQD